MIFAKNQGNISIYVCECQIQSQSTFHFCNQWGLCDQEPSAAVQCTSCQLDPVDNSWYH